MQMVCQGELHGFRLTIPGWTESRNVYGTYVGQEIRSLEQQLAMANAPGPAPLIRRQPRRWWGRNGDDICASVAPIPPAIPSAVHRLLCSCINPMEKDGPPRAVSHWGRP
jgi:hypothetical protein